MFAPAVKLFGRAGTAGAAAGLASLPAVAECRAPTAAQPGTALRDPKVSDAGPLSLDGASQAWNLVPEDGSCDLLSFEVSMEEVQTGLDDVLSIASGRSKVCRSNSGDDAESIESFGADADRHIEAAFELSAADARPQLSSAMHTLLNNVEVQRAVAGAIRDSPELVAMMELPELEHFRPLYATELLPPAANAALERCPADERNVLEKGLEIMTAGLAALGESIAGVGDGIASFLGRLCNSVRDALPLKPEHKRFEHEVLDGVAPGAASGGDCNRRRPRRAQLVAGTLFSLAVAVIAVVLFKRAGLVRIVRTGARAARA